MIWAQTTTIVWTEKCTFSHWHAFRGNMYISDTLNRIFLVGCDWCVDDGSDEDTGTDDEVAEGDDVGPSGDISLVMALSLLSVSDYLEF